MFPGAKISENISVTELYDFFKSVCQSVIATRRMFNDLIVNTLLLKSVNMVERIEIAESIYEGVVGPSYIKNHLGIFQPCR